MVDMKNVNVHYSSGVDALVDINLHINDGEFVFIVGESGAGKSTLMKLMMREIAPSSGRVFVNGRNLGTLKGNKIAMFRRSIGVVFQEFRLIQDYTVYENVAFALRVADSSNKVIRQRVPYVLNLVELGPKAKQKVRELSGGEQQRVAIARALANDPGLLIVDEPRKDVCRTLFCFRGIRVSVRKRLRATPLSCICAKTARAACARLAETLKTTLTPM